MEFTLQQVKELGGPGVYIFWRGDVCVYVGATLYGLGRAFSPCHAMRKFSDLTLEFIPMPDGKAAFGLEEDLICSLEPEYNSNMKYSKEWRRRYQNRYRAGREEERLVNEMLRANFGPHPKGYY